MRLAIACLSFLEAVLMIETSGVFAYLPRRRRRITCLGRADGRRIGSGNGLRVVSARCKKPPPFVAE